LLDDEYRAFVDKYSNVRNDFEARMTEACKVRVRSAPAYSRLRRAFIAASFLADFRSKGNLNTINMIKWAKKQLVE